MNFDAIIPVKIYFFNKGVGADVTSKTFTLEGDITDSNPWYSVYIARFNESFPGKSVIVGLNHIGFELEWNARNTRRGRYIEQLGTYIKTVSFSEQGQHAQIGFERGIRTSGWFVSNEKVHYTTGIVAIAVAD